MRRRGALRGPLLFPCLHPYPWAWRGMRVVVVVVVGYLPLTWEGEGEVCLVAQVVSPPPLSDSHALGGMGVAVTVAAPPTQETLLPHFLSCPLPLLLLFLGMCPWLMP